METIIPILLALAIFGLQAYSNYQKEQEKARKRNPAQGRPSASGGQQAESGTAPRPVAVPAEWLDEPHNIPPQEWQPEEIPTTTKAFDAYTGRVDTRKARQQEDAANRPIPERLEVTDTEEEEREERREYSFDLREAVIQSVILERPYR